MAVRWTLGCDAVDPERLAAFWAHALGYVKEPGYDYEGGASIVDPAGEGPAIGFLRVPEGKTAKNRVHIDVRVPTARPAISEATATRMRDKAAELVGAGATFVREETYDGVLNNVVLLDPEGNEFCVATFPND